MVSVVGESKAAEQEQEVNIEPAASTSLIGSDWLYRDNLRLDAGFYNEATMQAHRAMASSGLIMKRLGDVTENIFIPPRFKRVYVDKEHGVPFLQGTHIVHFRPTDLKYLSRSAHRNLDRWIIKSGWVLVTCSGTIGRVTIALKQWNNWAASQHILRIVPKSNEACPAGYIYAWLSSPLGQAQFNGIYGAVVDELTADHVANILIPVAETEEQQSMINYINDLALDAVATKERALAQDARATDFVSQMMFLGKANQVEADVEGVSDLGRYGIKPFPPGDYVVTNEMVNEIREELGI